VLCAQRAARQCWTVFALVSMVVTRPRVALSRGRPFPSTSAALQSGAADESRRWIRQLCVMAA
jgi:hypothetical protein